MANLLADIVELKRDIVAKARRTNPLCVLKEDLQKGNVRMAGCLQKGQWGLIAECKLQSPAKGRLCQSFSVEQLAGIYEENGANMLSVHTDPHFLGKNTDLQTICNTSKLPVLRKDFIIDEYQIYESRFLGADAVLLIVRILAEQQLAEYLDLAGELGMDVLVEVHDMVDMEKALDTKARFIGINNRNLSSFTTSIGNTLALLPYADPKRILISESGIHTLEDARRLKEAGCDGILVGEGLVTAGDIAQQTKELSGL